MDLLGRLTLRFLGGQRGNAVGVDGQSDKELLGGCLKAQEGGELLVLLAVLILC